MLDGFTVGITAERRWEEQAALFERQGATVVHGPTLRSETLASDVALRHATTELIESPPRVLLATTGFGIRSWLEVATEWGMGPNLRASLAGARIFARGPKAAAALKDEGFAVVSESEGETMADTVDMALPLIERSPVGPGRRVAVQLDGSGTSPQLARLRDAGADLVMVPVYYWRLPRDRRPAVRLAEVTIARRVHAVTFTAAPALQNWLTIASEEGIEAPLRQALTDGAVVIGCVGPVCAEAVIEAGVGAENVVVAPASRLVPLVDAVAQRLTEKVIRARADAGDSEFVVTGTIATVDGYAFVLSPTEARVLAALARQPNVVLSTEDLLQTVWDGGAQDPHLVEVVIARLRRRLGEHGHAITAVQRRGYTLRI